MLQSSLKVAHADDNHLEVALADIESNFVAATLTHTPPAFVAAAAPPASYFPPLPSPHHSRCNLPWLLAESPFETAFAGAGLGPLPTWGPGRFVV